MHRFLCHMRRKVVADCRYLNGPKAEEAKEDDEK